MTRAVKVSLTHFRNYFTIIVTLIKLKITEEDKEVFRKKDLQKEILFILLKFTRFNI